MSPKALHTVYRYGFYILLFVCGTQAYVLVNQPRNHEVNTAAANEKAAADPAINLLAKPYPLDRTPATRTETQETPAVPRVSKTKTLFELANNKAVTLRIEPLQRYNNTLSPGIAELFELSPAQVERINELIEQTEASLKLQGMSKATTTFDDGSLSIQIPPFLDEGTATLERFNDSLLSILGPEAFSDFQLLAGEKVEYALGQFGAEIATYDFSVHLSDTGKRIYKCKRTSKNGINTNTNSYSLQSLDGPSLQTRELQRVLTPALIEYLQTTPPLTLHTP